MSPFRPPFARTSVAAEVDDELSFHLEMTTRELIERGMTPQQARAEAERRVGDMKTVNDDCRRYGAERDRNERRAEYREELKQDVLFAVRQLLKARAFSAVSILTLALGIGATAAVFSALDAVVLRPLPLAGSERIVQLTPTRKGDPAGVSAPEFLGLRGTRSFSHVAGAILSSGVTIARGDAPELVGADRVTFEYFDVFAAKPMLGRTFSADEDRPGAPKVVVLSHRTWTNRFNADRGVIGTTVQLEGLPHTIIGVMPASFDFTRNSSELWLPLALSPEQATKYNEQFLSVYARLGPGVTLEQARAAATAAERVTAERFPDRVIPVTDFAIDVTRYIDRMVGNFASLLWTLLGAVGFVLLISCTNVANLLLARGTGRSKELAIRAALGAGRGRLVRQLLTESLVLASCGAVFGLAIAYGLLRVIVAISPASVPRLEQAHIDWRVLSFTLVLAFVCAWIFGLLPALRAAGPKLQGTLREGGRSGASFARDRLRGVLVTAEVALAITLLVGSGLLIRSAWRMQHVDPGFDPSAVLASRLILPAVQYGTPAAVTRTYAAIRDRAAEIPGVKSAAIVSIVPLTGNDAQSSVLAEGQSRDVTRPQANLRLAGPGFFSTLGIPFVAGRDFARADNAQSPNVAVINEALARKLWPSIPVREVLGKRIDAMSGKRTESRYWEVVGIVHDVHDASLAQPPRPEFYVPVDQTPAMLWPLIQRSLVVVVRGANANVDAMTFVKPLRRAVASVDASLPLADASTMTSYLEASLETAMMNTLLLSVLGGIALALAMVGIYGVVSYFVTQRNHEIGVRLALGATPALIWKFVVARGLTPIVAGLVVGFALSMATSRVIAGQLFQVSGQDPLTLVTVGGLLLIVGLVATYVPARRAMKVPPVVALNEG
jgi:predicted permease